MKINSIYFVSAFVFLSSCATIKKLESNAIKEIFSDKEIVELKELLDFVDTSIVEKYPNASDLTEAYHFYLRDRNSLDGIVNHGIFNQERQEQLTLINTLAVSSEIWNIDSTKFTLLGSTRDIDARGRYLDKYLRIMSNSTKFLEFYCDEIFFSDSINPSSTSVLFQNYRHFNLDREAERLIVAIHLLTMNAEIAALNNI